MLPGAACCCLLSFSREISRVAGYGGGGCVKNIFIYEIYLAEIAAGSSNEYRFIEIRLAVQEDISFRIYSNI